MESESGTEVGLDTGYRQGTQSPCKYLPRDGIETI